VGRWYQKRFPKCQKRQLYGDRNWKEVVENKDEWRRIFNAAVTWPKKKEVYNTDIIITD